MNRFVRSGHARCALVVMPLAASWALSVSGCGGIYYAATVSSAASRVEEARTLNAETLAPYEYYYAREHLMAAQFEAAEANYSDAANFAEIADEYGQKAVDVARVARRNSPGTP